VCRVQLKTFIKNLPKDQRDDFALRCGTSLGYLRLISYGAKPCSGPLAVAIERESLGAVTVADVNPDFADELAKAGYVRGMAIRTLAEKKLGGALAGDSKDVA
jgi:hypothetical protein